MYWNRTFILSTAKVFINYIISFPSVTFELIHRTALRLCISFLSITWASKLWLVSSPASVFLISSRSASMAVSKFCTSTPIGNCRSIWGVTFSRSSFLTSSTSIWPTYTITGWPTSRIPSYSNVWIDIIITNIHYNILNKPWLNFHFTKIFVVAVFEQYLT